MTEDAKNSPVKDHVAKKDAFADMVKKLAESFVSAEVKPPQVKESVLEFYAMKMVGLGYEMSRTSLQILCEYLKGYNLWLCGTVGVGKTYFFETMSRLRRAREMEPIVKLSMIETQGWTMDDASQWAREAAECDVLIDDVGAEPMLNHYGEKVEVFPYLLELRMQTRMRTHLTSNLAPKDILRRYDRRVADRFVQMFRMVEIKSKDSRRKLAPWKMSKDGSCVL